MPTEKGWGDLDVLLTEVKESIYANRSQLQKGMTAWCIHCERTIDPDDIEEWADGGVTAICPQCGVDAVLPSVSGWLTRSFLRAVRKHLFEESPDAD